MIKIGINGFGRIGRVILRILSQRPEEFEVCGVNLRKADIDYMVYLLKYDSVFRNFPGTVEHAGGDLVVNGRHIKVYSESDAAMMLWSYAVLAVISDCYPPVQGRLPTRYSPVRHSITKSSVPKKIK